MLGNTADGNKQPPFVIFKRKTVPKDAKFLARIHVRLRKELDGWKNDKDWVCKVWKKISGALLKKQPSWYNSLWEHFVDVKKKFSGGKTDHVTIHGGLALILQWLKKPI